PFFRHHHRLAHLYRELALSHRLSFRLLGCLISLVTPRGEGAQGISPLTTSAAHTHEREDDIQAAAEKLNRHLFEVQLRLVVTGIDQAAESAEQKLREIVGSFGLFSSPRLAVFKESARYVSPALPSR